MLWKQQKITLILLQLCDFVSCVKISKWKVFFSQQSLLIKIKTTQFYQNKCFIYTFNEGIFVYIRRFEMEKNIVFFPTFSF